MINVEGFDRKEILLKVLETITLYLLSEDGYFYSRKIALFNTPEEAAQYMGYSSYNDFIIEQKRNYNSNKNHEGFWCYSIERLDCSSIYENDISMRVSKEVDLRQEEIIRKSNKKIETLAQKKYHTWKEQAIQTLKDIE